MVVSEYDMSPKLMLGISFKHVLPYLSRIDFLSDRIGGFPPRIGGVTKSIKPRRAVQTLSDDLRQGMAQLEELRGGGGQGDPGEKFSDIILGGRRDF